MNNFTKTESLPKSGHVTEVCKEWLVREDGALAYKLQSQEINDFYKGNRFRNAVLREDFPSALQEQIKEHEHAEKQTEAYRRRLLEQEEHDKRMAREIAEKLERDQRECDRELHDSERLAQQMQEIYVNLPAAPPPSARDKQMAPPPPRPAKASTLQQQQQQSLQDAAATSSARNQTNNNNNNNHNSHHSQPITQQPPPHGSFTSNSDGYVGLCLAPSTLDAGAAAPAQRPKQLTPNQLLKLSPEKYDQLVGNHDGGAEAAALLSASAAERHMQQHADDIELYVDPCDYASLREIGLPMAEIKELSKKLKQEQKDAMFARRLQELESHDGLTQEDRDRLMAIEAQDKELAKMLQEREKAKAKRAKEKARLRKTQQKDSTTSCSSLNGLHCGPLLPLPQDCLSAAKHSLTGKQHGAGKSPTGDEDDALDMEAYSNPIDVISSQRMQNGGGGGIAYPNGSLTRETAVNSAGRAMAQGRDDDIYTLPVDSCRPGQRPASLAMGATESAQLLNNNNNSHNSHNGGSGSNNNSMTRSENYSVHSQEQQLLHNGHDVLPSMSRLNYSKSGTFGESASPTPPYMPIQGTRRSNSSEDRKKKSKDKCTHQ